MNTQFSIAVHLLTALGYRPGEEVPSRSLATSVNANPSFVRRILARLSKVGLVQTTEGKNGACRIARDAQDITLLQIYQAVEAPKAFTVHHYDEQKACVVSCHIKSTMERVLEKTQLSLEKSLSRIRLRDVIAEVRAAELQESEPTKKFSIE